jgi:hypothetical protein
MARVVGLRSGSAAHTSHHCSAHQLKGSWPRWSPCQAPRVTPRRFFATRSRASSLEPVSVLEGLCEDFGP